MIFLYNSIYLPYILLYLHIFFYFKTYFKICYNLIYIYFYLQIIDIIFSQNWAFSFWYCIFVYNSIDLPFIFIIFFFPGKIFQINAYFYFDIIYFYTTLYVYPIYAYTCLYLLILKPILKFVKIYQYSISWYSLEPHISI